MAPGSVSWRDKRSVHAKGENWARARAQVKGATVVLDSVATMVNLKANARVS